MPALAAPASRKEVTVRCSSFETLLDRYVEGTLVPRQMLAVS